MPLLVVSDTGPLISIFQSDSLKLVLALFGKVHTSEGCLTEVRNHGWQVPVSQAGSTIVTHQLTAFEAKQARLVAQRIASHPRAKNPDPSRHLGEAEVIILALRSAFAGAVLLLDERIARSVAQEFNLNLSGFAGMLLLAVAKGLLTADGLRQRLERCQQQGTHYSAAFIERVYQAAQERQP